MAFDTSAFALIAMLVGIELTRASGSEKLKRYARLAYLVVIPLLALFVYLTVAQVLPLLPPAA